MAVSDAGGIYTGNAFTATTTVAGVDGSASGSLEHVAPTLAFYAGTKPAGTPNEESLKKLPN